MHLRPLPQTHEKARRQAGRTLRRRWWGVSCIRRCKEGTVAPELSELFCAQKNWVIFCSGLGSHGMKNDENHHDRNPVPMLGLGTLSHLLTLGDPGSAHRYVRGWFGVEPIHRNEGRQGIFWFHETSLRFGDAGSLGEEINLKKTGSQADH